MMRSNKFALTIALGVVACTAQAQQQSMPDMNMPAQQEKPQQTPPQPNHARQSADPVPAKLKQMGHDTANARARTAAASVQQSFDQQAGQGEKKPGPESDASSIKLPIQELQEPEAIGFRTGSNLPAAELLRQVVDRQPMTVEDFVGLAEKSNPTLVQAQQNIVRSNQQARQLGLPPDPIVGYTADEIRGGEFQGGEQGAFISQIFVLGHKLALRRDVYRAEGRSNQFALEVQRARIHDDVAHSFFHTLAMQQDVVIRDRLLKVALDGETNSHELERIGQADAADVLTAEIAAEEAKVEFNHAQRMFLASFAQLATYAGQASLAAHPLTGALVEPPELDAEAMVGKDVQESPYVNTAQSNVTIAEKRLKDAKRERVPNLNVRAGEYYSGEQVNSGAKAGWESFAEAGLQLPLWNRNQGNVEAAKALVGRAQQDVARTQLWTRNQAEPYAQEYLTSRATAERYRTAMLPRARRAYQLQVTKYQQMALAYPNVLTAQHLLFTLQLSYVQALDREWGAAIALQEYALRNGLDSPVDAGDDSTVMNLPTGGNQ